jgi:HK97 gp10 family phage protein
MATWVKLSTKGFEEYLENLARAGKDIDAIADHALAAGGEVLLAGMKRRVPVGKAPDDPHPGNLKRTLRIDGPHRDGNFHYILVGLVNANADTARYGTAQEYGTARMAAQPYIRPTIDEDKGKAGKAMLEVFKEAGAL